MINQQVLTQLRKQARRQHSKFSLPRRPEIWQWAVAFLGRIASIQADKRSLKSLLPVQISGLEPELNWMELPPEWQGQQFIRLQYLAGTSRYLAWEICLEPHELIFQQSACLPSQFNASLDHLFKQYSQRLGHQLTQITTAFSKLEQAQSQKSTQISDYLPALNQIWEGVELSQIAAWVPLSFSAVLEQLTSKIHSQELIPHWFAYAPGEPRSQKINPSQQQITFPRWQSKGSLQLKQVYLCLLEKSAEHSLYLPLQLDSRQTLIWPGQSQVSQRKSPFKWQCPAFKLTGTACVQSGDKQTTEINLSTYTTQAAESGISGKVAWQHQEKHPLTLIISSSSCPQITATELLSHQTYWPILSQIWPAHKIKLKAAHLLSISSQTPFPLAWLNALESLCQQEGGAIFEHSPQGALILLPPTALISWLTFLDQSLRTLQSLLKSSISYQVLMHRGDIDIYLHEQRFRGVGQAIRYLSDMAASSEAESTFLVSAGVLAAPETQSALHQAGWQIRESKPLAGQALFLLESPQTPQG